VRTAPPLSTKQSAYNKKQLWSLQNGVNSTNTAPYAVENSTQQPTVKLLPSVEFSTPLPVELHSSSSADAPQVLTFDLSSAVGAKERRQQEAEAQRKATKYAHWAQLDEQGLMQLSASEMQEYKSAINRQISTYTARINAYTANGKDTSSSASGLMQRKLRLAELDRAKAKKEGRL
jgi:hypothetical protein